jgi:hypothetical protein
MWGDSSPYLPTPSPVDTPDDEYLEDHTTRITKWPDAFGGPDRPSFWGGGRPRGGGFGDVMNSAFARGGVAGYAAPMAAAAPAMAMAKTSLTASARAENVAASDTAGAAAAAPGAASLRLQSDFKVTPLFAVAVTGDDGVVTLPFATPANLGTFVIRAYVASPEDGEAATRYGAGDSSVVVRRPVSLVPSVPRLVRTGDTFEAGVIISAPGDAAVTVAVTASAGGKNGTVPVTLQSGAASDTASVPVPAGGQQELRFKFAASQVGSRVLAGCLLVCRSIHHSTLFISPNQKPHQHQPGRQRDPPFRRRRRLRRRRGLRRARGRPARPGAPGGRLRGDVLCHPAQREQVRLFSPLC